MASSENLEKRAEELFETLTDEDLENPKVFLDKKRRDIQNQAKELVKDIDDIIKCLENYHKTCGAFRTVGHMADASGTGEVIARSLIRTHEGHRTKSNSQVTSVAQLKQARTVRSVW